METINNAAAAVGNKINEVTGATKQEKGEQQMKHDSSLTGKVEGAKDYVSGATDKHSNAAKKEANNPLN